MEDDYRQPSPYTIGAALGTFSSSTEEHTNECIARIETLKLKVLGNPHMGGYERSEFLAELNTLRAAYLHLCTLSDRSGHADADADGPPPREANRAGLTFEGVLGNNPQITGTLDRIARIAPTQLTVLLEGETGSGKELFARIIHLNSKRSNFVPVNCGALPSGVIESELFGHVKGAFTGATADRKGRFEEAHGGTIFLDEIGELEPTAQVKLLRTLDVGEIQRVGSDKVQKVDVRVIAATNRNIEADVAAGRFRRDLYYRLAAFPIHLPTLAARAGDIPIIAARILLNVNQMFNRRIPGFDPETLRLMQRYPWPGNIRELHNEIQRMAVLCDGDTNLRPDLLSPLILDFGSAAAPNGGQAGGTLKERVEELERALIAESLKRNGRNISRVADELGLSRVGLRSKIARYDIRGDADDEA